MAENRLLDDNFLKIEDDYSEYIKYLRLIFTEYYEIIQKLDKIVEENVFCNEVYIELTGLIKYASKRVFPQLLAFFGQDENFEDDVYPEFMDIQLMVLYLFDKLQYELDNTIINWNFNDPVIDEDIINLESINYLMKLILPQLSLFAQVFDLKIQLLEGSITQSSFEKQMIEVHDSMFI